MHWSPFLEIFVGLFLALGVGIGWFTRIRVWVFSASIAAFVFGLLVILSMLDASASLSAEDMRVATFLATFAAVPAFITSGLARIIKRDRDKVS